MGNISNKVVGAATHKSYDEHQQRRGRGGIFRAAEEMLEQRLHLRLWHLLIAIMKIIIETLDIIVEDIDACIVRACRRWGIDAGQARYVKPHIDLMLKLHKMLRKAGHAPD